MLVAGGGEGAERGNRRAKQSLVLTAIFVFDFARRDSGASRTPLTLPASVTSACWTTSSRRAPGCSSVRSAAASRTMMPAAGNTPGPRDDGSTTVVIFYPICFVEV